MVFTLPPPRWKFRAELVKDWRDLARILENMNLEITGKEDYEKVQAAGLTHLFERNDENPITSFMPA